MSAFLTAEYLPRYVREDAARRRERAEKARQDRWLPYLHCLDQIETAQRQVTGAITPIKTVRPANSTEKWVLCEFTPAKVDEITAYNGCVVYNRRVLAPACMVRDIVAGQEVTVDLSNDRVRWIDHRTWREVTVVQPVVMRRWR